jgi:hypothetical protein
VDIILLIFDSKHKSIQAVLTDISSVHPNLRFTTGKEQNNTINYLDISIQKFALNTRIAIYRNSTFTDTTIPYSSIHPTQNK